MKKRAAALTVLAALTASSFTPAQAAGFAAKEAWTHGVDGINSFVSSRDCGFMEDHAPLMGYKIGITYRSAATMLTNSTLVRSYMSGRIDEGAGEYAKMIPEDVREKLIDLGIAGTLKKAAECKLVQDPDGAADKEYRRQLEDGNAAYSEVTVTGVLKETPSVLSSFLGSAGSSES